MAGPAVGGLVLVGLGVAPGFAINAASFALVVVVLAKLRTDELSPQTPVPRARGQVRQGLAYVCTDPVLATTSVVMIVVFATAYNFQVSLALIASDTLAGDGRTYGNLMSALGLGALVGSLVLARYMRTDLAMILLCAGALAVAQLVVSIVDSLLPLLVLLFAYGVSAGLFSVTVVSRLQSQTSDDMRGRVMAVHSICFLGSSLVGGPAFGALAGWIGVSGALRVAAAICTVVVLAILVVRQAKRQHSRVV
jgi:MFS family permease